MLNFFHNFGLSSQQISMSSFVTTQKQGSEKTSTPVQDTMTVPPPPLIHLKFQIHLSLYLKAQLKTMSPRMKHLTQKYYGL